MNNVINKNDELITMVINNLYKRSHLNLLIKYNKQIQYLKLTVVN